MTNKTENQTNRNLWKNKGRNSFSITEMMDLRSLQGAFSRTNLCEPEPVYINGKYLYV